MERIKIKWRTKIGYGLCQFGPSTPYLIILSTYKVNKRNFDLLCTALENKRVGKEYSTDGFKELL